MIINDNVNLRELIPELARNFYQVMKIVRDKVELQNNDKLLTACWMSAIL